MRPTELNGLLGLEQLKRLDSNNLVMTRNFRHFLSVLNSDVFQTDFKFEGSSNYAFTLVLNEANRKTRDRVEEVLFECRDRIQAWSLMGRKPTTPALSKRHGRVAFSWRYASHRSPSPSRLVHWKLPRPRGGKNRFSRKGFSSDLALLEPMFSRTRPNSPASSQEVLKWALQDGPRGDY